MENKRVLREFIWNIIAALSSALSDILAFTLLFHLGLYFLYCQAASRIVGGITSFLINKNFSFKKHEGRTLIEMKRFGLLYIASYLLGFCLLWLLYKQMGLSLIFAKPLADGICFIFNFFVMKYYVYSKAGGITAIGRSWIMAIHPIKGSK